jgi:hypothetical protein
LTHRAALSFRKFSAPGRRGTAASEKGTAPRLTTQGRLETFMMRRTSVAGWPSGTNHSANRVAKPISSAVPIFEPGRDRRSPRRHWATC